MSPFAYGEAWERYGVLMTILSFSIAYLLIYKGGFPQGYCVERVFIGGFGRASFSDLGSYEIQLCISFLFSTFNSKYVLGSFIRYIIFEQIV